MSYKLIVLAPSCGGKSTLMRYLREHTDLEIAETDEEIMKANNNIWPDDELKNKVLIPKTTRELIAKDSIIYFASYIPTPLLQEAKKAGFKITVLNIAQEQLTRRNEKRMREEGYDDVSPWFKGQLANFEELVRLGIVDGIIEGNRNVEQIAGEVLSLTTP